MNKSDSLASYDILFIKIVHQDIACGEKKLIALCSYYFLVS